MEDGLALHHLQHDALRGDGLVGVQFDAAAQLHQTDVLRVRRGVLQCVDDAGAGVEAVAAEDGLTFDAVRLPCLNLPPGAVALAAIVEVVASVCCHRSASIAGVKT